MASFETEVRFVGQFANYASRRELPAFTVLDIVRPGMLEDPGLEKWFGLLSGRFAAGEDLMDAEDDYADLDLWCRIQDESIGFFDLEALANRIRDNWRAREQHRLLGLAVIEADKAIASTNGKARKVADRLSTALMQLFADGGDHKRPANLAEIIEAERRHMEAPADVGITLPYPKLEHACGPFIPGDVVALPGYSNQGKSVLAANLAWLWARRGQPVIAFPAEMRERWLSRVWAAGSQVSQMIAEKRLWRRATATERVDYRRVLDESEQLPMQVVNRSVISPAEIIAATRILRRRWSGQTVLVIVDHMHGLAYNDDPNKAVGPATKVLKDFAENDSDGGLVLLLLYQARKPAIDVYRPIGAHEIRGDSTVWNVIDICISPFRTWVEADPSWKTPWGTPGTVLDNGAPRLAKPKGKAPKKLNDEHVFIKIDKRRVGGEGPTLFLDYDNPSGRIYELAEDPR